MRPATSAGATATPAAFVLTVTVRTWWCPDTNDPVGPAEGAENRTGTFATGLASLSSTVTASGTANLVPTSVVCVPAAPATTEDGAPARARSENASTCADPV